MKPEESSQTLLAITRSKAKMYEYGVPKQYHIEIPTDPAQLFVLAIGLLGDLAAKICAPGTQPDDLAEDQATLRFAAYFFDAYDAAKLDERIKAYLTVIGAAAYYLCDLQGSARVLSERLKATVPTLDCPELAPLLVWLVKGDFRDAIPLQSGIWGAPTRKVSLALSRFAAQGDGDRDLLVALDELRRLAYQEGEPRQLLFADIICALTKKRYWNSPWRCLPLYSGIAKKEWDPIVKRETFIRELWPAQHLLGEVGIYRGMSATVQMPTSAGKTRAVEIVIRCAFLSGRTSLAVVVAPFRALCHEIKANLLAAFEHDTIIVDELTDVLQTDFDIQEIFGRKHVLVLTPEKLVYVLRHAPELAERIGLVVYDEGHQFDNGIRGVTYELLLTTLKRMLPAEAQVLLISAVISNAEALNTWLNGAKIAQVVEGQNLTPTYRTIGFASWKRALGQISFVTPSNPDEQEFFVPRIIEQIGLKKLGRERVERLFPEKDDGGSIALYFGLKLASQGGVAIFCGTKLAAASLCRQVVEIYERGYGVDSPLAWSDRDEIARLRYLHEENLGADAMATAGAELGVFVHHASTPHGLRLAIEYAMQNGLARFVICTSTLAQGVNLPLRYLIVTSTYQGGSELKVRDFHNLIGRAGRSGMHTEGSIIFADPNVFDTKADRNEKWRWQKVKNLLEPGNSEPCASRLLTILEPLASDNNRLQISMQPLEFIEAYINESDAVSKTVDSILKSHPREFTRANLERQIEDKMAIIRAVESFLMAEEVGRDLGKAAKELAEGTFAHHLASSADKKSIVSLFTLLAAHVTRKIPDQRKWPVLGKTLLGVEDALAIERWVTRKADAIAAVTDADDFFDLLWPVLSGHIRNRTFRNCQSPGHLKRVARAWFEGTAFKDIYPIFADEKIKIGSRNPTIEHVVEICEVALSYEGMLIVGAVRELFVMLKPEAENVDALNLFQKRMKHGLNSLSAVILFEMGFLDRVICAELEEITGEVRSRARATNKLKKMIDTARAAMDKYPAYFRKRLEAVV